MSRWRALRVVTLASCGWTLAQDVPAPPPPADPEALGETVGTNAEAAAVVYEPPKPVLIEGRPAEELDADQIQEFLQSKVRDVHQGPDEVLVVRVSPGYPVTLSYDEPVGEPIRGDPDLLGVTVLGRSLVIAARDSTGDTSLVVPLSGNRMLPCHVFVEPTFAKTDTLLKVHVAGTSRPGSGSVAPRPNLSQIASVIGNYDALRQEGALDARAVRRVPIGRRSSRGTFTYHDWFLFADGTAALTFAATAPAGGLLLPRSRFRLEVGGMRFVPGMVAVGATRLPAGGTTDGFLVFPRLPFVSTQPLKILDQPFEIVLP